MSYLMRATVIAGAKETITELGGDGNQILRQHGIDPSATDDFDRYVQYEAAAAVLGYAARVFDCPDFGLRVGMRQGTDIIGPHELMLRNAGTVGEGVTNVCRFLSRTAPGDSATLDQTPGKAVYAYTAMVHDKFNRRQTVEKSQAFAMRSLRAMIGLDFAPVAVTFAHSQYAPLESYRKAFGTCPIEFDRDMNSIHIAPRDLARPIENRNPAALALAESHLSRMRPDVPLTEGIREITRRLLPLGGVSLREVAAAVAVHERTLQRQLASEGTTFEAIFDDLRRTLAWELAATGSQASQVSQALGYTEQSSFTRACRRWYGMSPRELLHKRQGQAPELPPPLRKGAGPTP